MRAICGSLIVGLTLVFLLAADAPSTAPATAPYPEASLSIGLGKNIAIDLVLIKPGTFIMGRDNVAKQDPGHKVTITKGFYIGKYEVTQEQWQAVVGNNPSQTRGAKNPVDNVSWQDCMDFLTKLSKLVPDKAFALPTEAQWEYACRAGTTSFYSWGNPRGAANPGDVDSYAWRDNGSHAVGGKKPNPWGLYDMSGNVWEWCADWFGPYEAADAIDPPGPLTGTERTFRGGGYTTAPGGMGSAFRASRPPDQRDPTRGLRIVYMPGVAK